MAGSVGERGKSAEAMAREFLVYLDAIIQAFDFERNYDARSAGGRFQSQVGDFNFYSPERFGSLEVKELAHDYRLPAKNFKKEQIARLAKRELAGGLILVPVYHSKLKRWRLPPFDLFRDNRDLPSWDLRPYPTYLTLRDALLPYFLKEAA